jgi:cell division septal protein FtsQ
MDYGKLCKEILDLDPKIRFAGVCDDNGETKYGGQREGVKNLLLPEETKKSNLQALARWALRNALSSKVGKGRYAMAEYEKVKRITIPLDDNNHLLLVTTEVIADHDRIIDKVLKSVQHS